MEPRGVVVDQLGTVYVADCSNSRIIRWLKNATQGNVIIGGNGNGARPNQLSCPEGLAFDRYGNLYVADSRNNRVQRFDIKRSS
jgi:sugar lactone lactonase YvrE